MKRGFGRGLLGRSAAVLCLSLFLVMTLSAETRRAALVQVSNEAWSTRFIASDASAQSTVRETGCLALTGLVGEGISTYIPDAARCAPAGIASIATFEVIGDARLTTDAIYRDAHGNFNTVEIEELEPAL